MAGNFDESLARARALNRTPGERQTLLKRLADHQELWSALLGWLDSNREHWIAMTARSAGKPDEIALCAGALNAMETLLAQARHLQDPQPSGPVPTFDD